MTTKYTFEQYLLHDPFQDTDSKESIDIRLQSAKMVRTRAIHLCALSGYGHETHVIPPRALARYDKALVDGQWGGYWICIECLDEWLDELGPEWTDPR